MPHAQFTIDKAWDARGNGAAQTVTAEQQAIYRARITEAHAELLAMPSADRRDPLWYSSMLQVAKAQAWPADKHDKLYLEGVRKFPEWINLHRVALNFNAPKWYGSDQRLTWFIERAAKMTRAKTGEMDYARLHQSADTLYLKAPDNWLRRRAGLLDLVKHFPSAWNSNRFAEIACIKRDLPMLTAQLAILDRKPDPAAWRVPDVIGHCLAAEQTDIYLRESGKSWSYY